MESPVKQQQTTPALDRASGILLHISSLPGPYGIGDLGPAAFAFVDFLAAAGQRYWQLLPLSPVDLAFGCSPYMGLAALAGNPMLISPDLLLADGLLTASDLERRPFFSEYLVDFPAAIAFKKGLLAQAYQRLPDSPLKEEFQRFCQSESSWLLDYSLFMAIRQHEAFKPWCQWPAPLKHRDPSALTRAAADLAQAVDSYRFEQFLFFRQWLTLRAYAHEHGVSVIGDLPIYVSLDSADVWANQDCFQLNPKTSAPTHVAGVPPDYFSETGQRWGNPLYRWKHGSSKNEALYAWWRRRFRQLGRLVDLVRIDHFRGFESYWQIPATEETAVKGKWVKGPGRQFFTEMAEAIAGLPIIAEDLGVITPEVIKLRDELGFPGMKILQFAFDSDERNLYLPHNFDSPNCVVFTGTHDNNTSLGWYMEDASTRGQARIRRYANSEAHEIHWDFIRLALSSVAATCIVPMQDILGFGGDCRMNLPGTVQGNWRWRCAARFMTQGVAERLRGETAFYGRERGGEEG